MKPLTALFLKTKTSKVCRLLPRCIIRSLMHNSCHLCRPCVDFCHSVCALSPFESVHTLAKMPRVVIHSILIAFINLSHNNSNSLLGLFLYKCYINSVTHGNLEKLSVTTIWHENMPVHSQLWKWKTEKKELKALLNLSTCQKVEHMKIGRIAM